MTEIDVRSFGAYGNGAHNDAPAFQAAIDVARAMGGTVVVPTPPTSYLLENELDLTNPPGSISHGFTIRGTGNVNTGVTGASALITVNHEGHAFDCTGSLGLRFDSLSIQTGPKRPQTCFLLARNADKRSCVHRFTNVAVRGAFSNAVVYNYGAEDDQYESCYFSNDIGSLPAKVMVFTANNVFKVKSSFTTIAEGTVTTIDHKIFGGEIFNQSMAADADCIYLENTASLKVIGSWMGCGSERIGISPRSLIYVDMSVGPSWLVTLIGVTGEHFTTLPRHGVEFSNHRSTPSYWTIDSCTFPNTTHTIHAPANASPATFYIRNVGNQSAGGGMNFAGSLTNSVIHDVSGNVAIGTSVSNVLTVPIGNLRVGTRRGDYWTPSGSQSWTPDLSDVRIGGATTVSNASVHYSGRQVTVTMICSGHASFAIAAGGTIRGLPVPNAVGSGVVTVINMTTNVLMGTGWVNGTSIVCPRISVGRDRLGFTATYFGAA
jgi:hypothetical protein